MGEYQKDVVVRVPNWIGDAILSFPSLKAIAGIAGRVTVVSHSRTAPLFGKLQWVDEVLSFRCKKELFWHSLKLRSRKLSTGMVFPFSFSSAGFIYLAGAEERIGYSLGLRRMFLTEALRLAEDYRSQHLAYTYFRLATSIHPGAQYSHPLLPVRSSSRDGLLIGIAPGATFGPAKRWRSEKFVKLVDRLVNLSGCRIYVLGGKEESPMKSKLSNPVRSKVEDYTGKTDILTAASLIAQCKVMVSNDTGILHLAAAVGTPVIALFGSTNPSWTGPLGQNHSIIRKNLPCSPCYHRRCPYGTYDCLNKITVEEVLDCVKKYL